MVDADLRSPAIHKVFDLKNGVGLAQVVLQDASVEEALTPSAIEGLQIVTSGTLSNLDATLILGSPEMNRVADALSNHADLVIYDSSPLIAVTDPMILVPLVEGVLLVIDTQRTKRQATKRAHENLQRANPAYVGVVLNKVTVDDAGSTYYYYYYHTPEGNGQLHRPGILNRVPVVSRVLNKCSIEEKEKPRSRR